MELEQGPECGVPRGLSPIQKKEIIVFVFDIPRFFRQLEYLNFMGIKTMSCNSHLEK